jgi:hypothetical protein
MYQVSRFSTTVALFSKHIQPFRNGDKSAYPTCKQNSTGTDGLGTALPPTSISYFVKMGQPLKISILQEKQRRWVSFTHNECFERYDIPTYLGYS